MRKSIFLILTLCCVLVPFVSAGGTAESGSSTGPIVLTGMVRDYSMKADPPWQSAATKFKELHPNVEIKLEGLPYNDQREKTLITVGAGKGPDIAQVDCIWLGEFASNKIIIDMTDMINGSPGLKEGYYETFQKSATWQGRDYGLWLWTDVRTLAWHKPMFSAAGLDPNTPPKTWADLRTYATKLNRPEAGVWGYAFPAAQTDHTADRWYPFLYMGGGQILSDDYTKAAFNSQAGVQALQLLVDLMNTDKVSPKDLLGIQENDVSNGFLADKYAMMIKVGEFWKDYRNDKNFTVEQYKNEVGVAPLPVPPGGQLATGSGGWIAGITRDSKHPDLVFEYLKMVVDPQNMSRFNIADANLPTTKASMQFESEFAQAIPYFNVASQVLPVTHFRPPIPEYTKISAEIVDAIQQALSLQATPQAALDRAAEKVNAILAERKW